jgi:acyl carrier protein
MCATLETLRLLLADHLVLELEAVSQSSTFEDLHLDSLDHVMVINEIEDTFDITITDEEALACDNVDYLYKTILSKF